MFSIGLTGGIGSGKSLVASVFAKLGVPVFEADRAGAVLMDQDEDLKAGIRRCFGEKLFEGSSLNRPLLASIVFADQARLELLNRLVHPKVFAEYRKWLSEQNDVSYVIHEAAILFESGAASLFDAILTVEASEALRIRRVKERNGMSEELIRQRMAHQWSAEERMKQADFVLFNNEEELIIPEIIRLHERFASGRIPRKEKI